MPWTLIGVVNVLIIFKVHWSKQSSNLVTWIRLTKIITTPWDIASEYGQITVCSPHCNPPWSCFSHQFYLQFQLIWMWPTLPPLKHRLHGLWPISIQTRRRRPWDLHWSSSMALWRSSTVWPAMQHSRGWTPSQEWSTEWLWQLPTRMEPGQLTQSYSRHWQEVGLSWCVKFIALHRFVASFPGLLHLQFLVAWGCRRSGNEATDM